MACRRKLACLTTPGGRADSGARAAAAFSPETGGLHQSLYFGVGDGGEATPNLHEQCR